MVSPQSGLGLSGFEGGGVGFGPLLLSEMVAWCTADITAPSCRPPSNLMITVLLHTLKFHPFVRAELRVRMEVKVGVGLEVEDGCAVGGVQPLHPEHVALPR